MADRPLIGPHGKLIELRHVEEDGQHWIAVQFEGEGRVLFGPCRDAAHAQEEIERGEASFRSVRNGRGN